MWTLSLAVATLFSISWALPPVDELSSRSVASVCSQIQSAISADSAVFFPGSFSYAKDISHWASSSTQVSVCSVEPGTPEDIGIILQILGSTNTPFAVKGGGHASNPGFSSTTGVTIAMYRFSEVSYDAASQTATIGTGLIWDDVYAGLEPFGVNVVGGRVTGVGVAGFSLGGGYSWKSNQYGLTVDTITSFELVRPDGTVITVTNDSDSELFFGLKGGLNNFGIVTRFTLETHPQTDVWGGLITFTADQIPAVTAATANFFSSVTDPKASLITTYNSILGLPGISLLLFYDGPTPPSGIFDDFLSVPHFTEDISTRSFSSLVQASPSNATSGTRAIFNTVPLQALSPTILNAIVNETEFWGAALTLQSGTFISYDVEPFLPSVFTQNTLDTAYPSAATRSHHPLPLNLYYAWALDLVGLTDHSFHHAVRQSAQHLMNVALQDGQDVTNAGSTLYPNYAVFDTPLEKMYGENVDRLHALKQRIDPDNVMGLAGGFKF